jgi:hypothetical protein
MNVPTLTMPADLAREKYEQYQAALADREPTPEDAEIMLGYKTLAAGKQLLDLRDVFRTCPLTATGHPKFAIARASWRWCFFEVYNEWATFASRRQYSYVSSWKQTKPVGHIRIRTANMPPTVKGNGRALVPIIPPAIRPKAADLSRYHILFEAEWQPIPPKDPLLLKKLSGTLYVILAAWDLTDLERAVLAGRLNEQS